MAAGRTTSLLICVRCTNIYNFCVLQRMLLTTVFRNEALMFWHTCVVATNHILSCIWAPSHRTYISLLNMIIRIKIRIYLYMIIVATRHWWFKLIKDLCIATLHIAVKWVLRHICYLGGVVSFVSVTAQEISIALCLNLESFFIFVLS